MFEVLLMMFEVLLMMFEVLLMIFHCRFTENRFLNYVIIILVVTASSMTINHFVIDLYVYRCIS